MKEFYISPEVKLVSFVAAERLANGNVLDFDNFFDGGFNNPNGSTGESVGDLKIELK